MAQLTREQQSALMIGVAGETVLSAAGVAMWFATGEILWILAGVIGGSAVLVFMLARAGVFSSPPK